MRLRVPNQSWRCFSSILPGSRLFSEEELQAVLELKRRSDRTLSKSAENVLKSRSWARAPVLEVSGRKPPASWHRVSKKGNRFAEEENMEQSVIKLRWANLPERDVDVLLPPDENLYTVEVKAVLYGIINGIDWGETKLRMKSSNEIVVKVANKRYNASKETASFHLITRVVNGGETKTLQNQLKAKLERIAVADHPIRRIAATTMTENEFFQKYRDSIDVLKTYT